MKIQIKKRGPEDWHAQISGMPGKWQAGMTPGAAIGNLIMSHPDMFPEIDIVEVPA